MFLKFLILSLSIAFSSACIDVCRGRPGNHFAVNPRGCAWYFRCNVGQEAQEGRCPGDFVFSYERQMCDYRENVQCEDPEIRTECPPTGIDVIKHPHVCSKYVGEFLKRFCDEFLTCDILFKKLKIFSLY